MLIILQVFIAIWAIIFISNCISKVFTFSKIKNETEKIEDDTEKDKK